MVKAALGKPEVAKLKALGAGVKVSRVLGERVMVKLVRSWTQMDEVEKKGLLFIPDTVKEKHEPLPSVGVIVQVGTGVYNGSSNNALLEEGVAVMFSRYAGTDFVVEEEDFRVLDVREILCILEVAELAPLMEKGSEESSLVSFEEQKGK